MSDGTSANPELAALQLEIARLREKLRAEQRLQRLIAESHSARDDFSSSVQADDPNGPLRTRIEELEVSLRLAQYSRPYRAGQRVRRAIDAVKRRGRRADHVDADREEPPKLPVGVGRPVVFFVPWLTHGGGGDQFVRDLAQAFVREGRTVVIIVTQGCPLEMTDATSETLEITPHVLDLADLRDPGDGLAFCEMILRRLDRPVIINVGSKWLYRHLRPLRAAAGDGVTVIDQVFNHVGHVVDDVAAGDAVDLTAVAHDMLRRLLVEHYAVARPVTTVHVGLRSLGEPRVREESSQLPLVVWLGRLSSEKRPLWFVDLASELDGRARFVLAGTGPQLQEVARRAHSVASLELAGFVQDSIAVLDAADLLVLTSEVEGISVVAMEAIARGVPVIATDVGGMADLIRHGMNGELVSADDFSELVDTVGRLLKAPDQLRALQDRVRAEGLLEDFKLAAMIGRYRTLVA
jgi:glycosyltransferase involved in cell wall biosynthesis